MRFMMLLKADKRTEAGELPTAKDLEVMGKYNEELVKAGVLLDGAGLQPSSKGAKVTFPMPFHMLPQNDGTPEIELRQMFEITDFPDVPPEVAKLEQSFTAGRAGQK